MRGTLKIYFIPILTVIVLWSVNSSASDLWQAPFDSSSAKKLADNKALFLDDVLKLVAANNPAFKSFDLRLKAANYDLDQAGQWSNPELGVEFEEVGWDAPGFKESEFSLSIAQEFEFFGQRPARKNVARAQINSAKMSVKLSAFDLYLETKQRFYSLAHAQQNVTLAKKSVELALEIVENTNYRLNRGAGLQSESLLAQLEQQRLQLALDQAVQVVLATEARLISLWNGTVLGSRVISNPESDLDILGEKIKLLTNQIDVSRNIVQKKTELDIMQAEKRLAVTEARPAVTLSTGYKRLAFDKSKSFLFGFSMPLPIFNRNQGTRQSLEAQIRATEYDIEQAQIEANSNIKSQTIRFKNLVNSHGTLDSLLLPTAEKAYRTLQKAYESGRVPFTQLLEAERALNDLSFEHNDMILAIQEQIIALESLTGAVLHVKKEN